MATARPTPTPIDTEAIANSVVEKLIDSDFAKQLRSANGGAEWIHLGPFRFSEEDAWLVQLCPVVAMAGMFIGLFVQGKSAQGNGRNWLVRGIRGVLLALMVGLAVAAFFIGAVKKADWTMFRVLLLTLLLGVQTEAVWAALCNLALAIFTRGAKAVQDKDAGQAK
jgi:hypothetical protein